MMKTFRLMVALLPVLLACQRTEILPASDPTPGEWIVHKISAAAPGEELPQVRTGLSPENDTKIRWSAGEDISILSGSGNYRFTGTNTQPESVATFSGNGPADLGDYIALYPYDAHASCVEGTVSTTLAALQTGKAGSFADGCLVTADDATGDAVTFRHLCSGLRFKVSRSDISAVSIRGNSGEKIAGDFQFHFASADTPSVGAGTEETVTLDAPDGCFLPGEWYYIIILPTTFSQGFTLTAEFEGLTGTLKLDGNIVFKAGAFKNITGSLDARMTWPEAKAQACYGPQNSFCLRPDEQIQIDVTPHLIVGAWQRSGISADADVPDGYEVLWGNSSASLSGTTLTVTAASTEESSLIAIKKGGTILWSYLIWVTAGAPAELTLPGGGKILPPLGGNLYFQWGRKDPLRTDCGGVPNQGDNGLDYSIAHPEQFIRGGSEGAYDWFCGAVSSQDGTLWGAGGSKTVWDPCPQGYRVPSEDDFTHADFDFTYLWNHFDEWGYLYDSNNGFYATCRSYWTRTPSGSFSTVLDDGDDPNVFYGQSRYIAAPVRCIKE